MKRRQRVEVPEASRALLESRCHRGGPTSLTTALGAAIYRQPARDPANADRRSRSASKAARSKPNRELAALKGQLRAVADGVLSGAVEPKRGAVAVQALSALIRAIEQERKIKELEEIEERLGDLERRKGIA